MSDQNWRTDVDAGDYFLHQKKQLNVADRRPVIRRASDLVGPGIGATTVRLTDFNDLLATFNGYYSSAPGATGAPNTSEAFVGVVLSDAEYGGRQEFTGLTSGIEYTRTFVRAPDDPESVSWGMWRSSRATHASAQGYVEVDTNVPSSGLYALRAPNVTLLDGEDTYLPDRDSIQIIRPGVYTGMIQVGDRTGDTTLDLLYVYRPNGLESTPLAQRVVPLAPTVHIPFTCWASDAGQGFSVAVKHTAGAPRDLWWRFSCTRVGDA